MIYLSGNSLRAPLPPSFPGEQFAPRISPTHLKEHSMNSDSLATIDGRFQTPTPQYTLSEPERRQRVLELTIGYLIARTVTGEIWFEGFADVDVFLEAAPLATVEFRSAKSHLQNAASIIVVSRSSAPRRLSCA